MGVRSLETIQSKSDVIRVPPQMILLDYVRPTAQKVRMVITIIKEIEVNNKVQITFSGLFQRDDQDFEEEIKEINRNLENLCKSKGVKFINNNTLK